MDIVTLESFSVSNRCKTIEMKRMSSVLLTSLLCVDITHLFLAQILTSEMSILFATVGIKLIPDKIVMFGAIPSYHSVASLS